MKICLVVDIRLLRFQERKKTFFFFQMMRNTTKKINEMKNKNLKVNSIKQSYFLLLALIPELPVATS